MFLMRKICVFLFLILNCAGVFAQDSTYVIPSSEIGKQGVLRLPDMTEWRFKEGNDTAWASPDFDHSQWQKLDSTEIVNIKVDEDGIFECCC